MNEIKVNVGNMSSFNSLAYKLAPKFQEIRNEYLVGKTPEILFDFKDIAQGNHNIGMAGITALVSAAKKLRDYVGHPLKAQMPWNPWVQSFLSDIGFFEVVNKFSIFDFSQAHIGGYITGPINTFNRIIYFGDILKVRDRTPDEIAVIKATHKQKISPNLQFRMSKILEGINPRLQNILLNTTLELIVNSLVHAEDYAFVGMQKSSKRVTISVCDSGLGFAKSLVRTFPEKFKHSNLSHINGILWGSIIQKNEHGLRLAISEVLKYDEDNLFSDNNEGWVIISSFDSEIRWQKRNWAKALNYSDTHESSPSEINASKILGNPLNDFAGQERIHEGYWKEYNNYLVGTRITFEIPLNP